MRLFPHAPGADDGPAGNGEPHIDYLDRTSRAPFFALRGQLQSWLDEIPHAHRRDLGGRLRSRDDHHFEAAFFELYLYALFRRMGFRLRLHPRAGNRGARPDFLLLSDSTSPVLVEAATVDELSATGRAARRRLVTIYDALNTLSCPDYFLHVEHIGEPASPIPLRSLKTVVGKFIRTLNYDDVVQLASSGRLDELPQVEFRHGGCAITVSVVPVSPGKRGSPDHRPVGMIGPGEAHWTDDRTPIRDKIRSKASKYGSIRRPLVIAVNAAGRHIDQTDIMEALFGRETFTYSVGAHGEISKPTMGRVPDGAWLGPRGPQNRRISGVIVVSSLLPWTATVHPPVLYHNPWARYPLDTQFRRLTSFAAKDNRMVETPGDPIHTILGLPERWPHNIPDSV